MKQNLQTNEIEMQQLQQSVKQMEDALQMLKQAIPVVCDIKDKMDVGDSHADLAAVKVDAASEGLPRAAMLSENLKTVEKQYDEMARLLHQGVKGVVRPQYVYKYPRPSVTADCVVLTQAREVLLVRRGNEPFKGCWALPGGFMDLDETAEQCAMRELREETGLEVAKVKQIGAYTAVDRDPRGRTITVAFVAEVDSAVAVSGSDDAAEAQWFPIDDLPQLAFDHAQIIANVKDWLKSL